MVAAGFMAIATVGGVVLTAAVFGGGGSFVPDAPSAGVPRSPGAERSGSEAEENTLTPGQARPEGNRTAPGNRLGPLVRASWKRGAARSISGPSPLAGC